MDQKRQASTGRNVQEQSRTDESRQNASSATTDNRNEAQNTSVLSHAEDHENAPHEAVEMDSQSTSDAPTADIIDTTEFQTMNSNGTTVLPREQQSTQEDISEISGGSINTNLFTDQTQQNQHLETEVQSNPHQNAHELAHFLMLSSQHQQQDGSTSLLPLEGRTNIVDDGSAIPSASATPTDSHGESNSITNFDDQADNLSTALQISGDPLHDYDNQRFPQGSHEREGIKQRFHCLHCPENHPGFTRKRDIRRHLNQVNREGHIRHFCHICRRGYFRRDVLNRHLRNHN